MNDGYGKLFLLLLAIGLIFLAASGKGKAVWSVLTGKTTSQSMPSPNPTDLRTPGSYLGNTDATKGANVG